MQIISISEAFEKGYFNEGANCAWADNSLRFVNYFLYMGRCIQAVKEFAQKTSMHALSAENLSHN